MGTVRAASIPGEFSRERSLPTCRPVMQSTKFDFVINLNIAKALGVAFPPGLLAIADEVIE
jgi:ABC-type uncharacterized transport system substrate-binding protein